VLLARAQQARHPGHAAALCWLLLYGPAAGRGAHVRPAAPSPPPERLCVRPVALQRPFVSIHLPALFACCPLALKSRLSRPRSQVPPCQARLGPALSCHQRRRHRRPGPGALRTAERGQCKPAAAFPAGPASAAAAHGRAQRDSPAKRRRAWPFLARTLADGLLPCERHAARAAAHAGARRRCFPRGLAAKHTCGRTARQLLHKRGGAGADWH
jgi:hypothetical protein